MAILTVVVGLPGAGKSSYMQKHKLACPGVYAEDYMAGSRDDSSHLRDSRHHEALVHNLNDGKDCMLADIELCRREKQQELEAIIREHAPGTCIRWVVFRNDAAACKRNALRRARSGVQEELTKIDRLSRIYYTPANTQPVPVWPAETIDQAVDSAAPMYDRRTTLRDPTFCQCSRYPRRASHRQRCSTTNESNALLRALGIRPPHAANSSMVILPSLPRSRV